MGYVFVSYHRSDVGYVDRLVTHLEAAGVEVWIDRGDIQPGARYRRVIEQAINDCDAFLIVLSPRAKTSDWVENELDWAEQQGKPIYSLLLEGRPWFGLTARHYEDVVGATLPSQRLMDLLPTTDTRPADPDTTATSLLVTHTATGDRIREAGAPPEVDLVEPAGDPAQALPAEVGPPALSELLEQGLAKDQRIEDEDRVIQQQTPTLEEQPAERTIPLPQPQQPERPQPTGPDREHRIGWILACSVAVIVIVAGVLVATNQSNPDGGSDSATADTVTAQKCTSIETSNSPEDALATLQVINVCPPLKGDITTVDGNHGADCMYDSTTTGPIELTLRATQFVDGLRIQFSGNAPAGSTISIALDDQPPEAIPIKATISPNNAVPFLLSQPASVDQVTVTPPVGICHLTVGA